MQLTSLAFDSNDEHMTVPEENLLEKAWLSAMPPFFLVFEKLYTHLHRCIYTSSVKLSVKR